MKLNGVTATIVGIAAISISTLCAAQQADFGKREYDSKCSACHGKQGEGDGAQVFFLDTRIADLTALSKKNSGAFPFRQVYETLDGRYLKAQNLQDMPIWGNLYMTTAIDLDLSPHDSEAYVRDRILALTEYIYGMQSK
jgi:hypothetical protein